MNPLVRIVSLVVVLVGVGCATPRQAVVVRAADAGQQAVELTPDQVLVIEFQPGDELPLELSLEGPLMQGPVSGSPVRFRAVRHFFLRVDEHGASTSLDGKTFGDNSAPGALRFGLGVTRAEGVKATLSLRTPTPREP